MHLIASKVGESYLWGPASKGLAGLDTLPELHRTADMKANLPGRALASGCILLSLSESESWMTCAVLLAAAVVG